VPAFKVEKGVQRHSQKMRSPRVALTRGLLEKLENHRETLFKLSRGVGVFSNLYEAFIGYSDAEHFKLEDYGYGYEMITIPEPPLEP